MSAFLGNLNEFKQIKFVEGWEISYNEDKKDFN